MSGREDELVSREMAIGVVGRRCGACIQGILDIPSAVPDSKESSSTHKALDTISRRVAIDALDALCDRECEYSKKQRSVMCGACHLGSAFDVVEQLPSAQSEITEEEVREWCYKRCLTVIDNALYLEMRSRWSASAQPKIEERKEESAQNVPKEDLISRKAAIDAAKRVLGNREITRTMQTALYILPSAQTEWLTDKEQRIFLAAMGREEKICKQVDEECRDCREPYEDSLVWTCHEITRKVKGALWTI